MNKKKHINKWCCSRRSCSLFIRITKRTIITGELVKRTSLYKNVIADPDCVKYNLDNMGVLSIECDDIMVYFTGTCPLCTHFEVEKIDFEKSLEKYVAKDLLRRAQ